MDQLKSVPECATCGHPVRRVSGHQEVSVGRRTAVVEVEYSRCDQCDEDFLEAGDMREIQRRASSQMRTEEGLLSGAEVKAIREGLGFSQAEFEEYLGVGKKTVVRWERETVFPSRSTDLLLRLIRDVPGTAEAIGEMRGVDAKPFWVHAGDMALSRVPTGHLTAGAYYVYQNYCHINVPVLKAPWPKAGPTADRTPTVGGGAYVN